MRRFISIFLVTGLFAVPAFAGSSLSESKTSLGLANVENTAISTWAGSTNVTTVGTIATGTWNATAVGVAKGGTALTAVPTNGQLPIGNGTNYTLAALTGTANQVTVTNGAGSITLATPQDLHTAATPQWAKIGVGAAAGDDILKLGVNDATAIAGSALSGRTLSGITIYNSNTTADSGSAFVFELGSAGTAYAGIAAARPSADNTDLYLYTEDANTVKERLKIDSIGRLRGDKQGMTYMVGGKVAYSTTSAGNAGGGADTTIFSNSIDGNTLYDNGDAITYKAGGTWAANSDADKRIKVKFGATTVYDSGAQGAQSAIEWMVNGRCIRTGAATQKCITTLTTSGSGVPTHVDYATAAETLSGAVTLAFTLASTTASTLTGEIWEVGVDHAP